MPLEAGVDCITWSSKRRK